VIGAGFYTTPVLAVNMPSSDQIGTGLDSGFTSPDWLSGYLFGLATAREKKNNPGNEDSSKQPSEYPQIYMSESSNDNNVMLNNNWASPHIFYVNTPSPPAVPITCSSNLDEHYCNDYNNAIMMDFSDGGAGGDASF
jgi:hypothetical protein